MTNNKSIISAGLFFLLGGIAVWTYNISTNTATSVATDVSTSVATDVVTEKMTDVIDDIVIVATDVSTDISTSIATDISKQVSTSVATDVVADAMNDSADDLVNRVTASLAENNSLNVESNLDIEEIANTHPEMTNNNPNTSCENIKFEIGSSTEPDGMTYEQRCEILNRVIDKVRASGSVCDSVSYFDAYVNEVGIEKSWTLKCNNRHYIHEYSFGVLKSLDPDDIRQESDKAVFGLLLAFILIFGLAIIAIYMVAV